jgi:hypothetical protein
MRNDVDQVRHSIKGKRGGINQRRRECASVVAGDRLTPEGLVLIPIGETATVD